MREIAASGAKKGMPMVYILGGWQSDFAANWSRQGIDIADAFAECVREGLAATALDARDIETGHVGNFTAELFARQGLLGGFFAEADPAFDGMPSARHEAACASGSVALLAATAEIEAGRYGLACVVGIEQMRNVPVRGAIEDARRRAGVTDIAQLDAVETHDCFTSTEYMAIDHLGLTDPGQSWRAIEDGSIEMGGRLPVNPSGGLIGLGHPVGATGVRMLLDAAKQVSGGAGDYQVERARRMQTLNIGGSATTTVSFIVEREAA
jgi:acetyl-CoA acetyltransferase